MAGHKFTLRRSGARLCTLRITHHVGREDLVWHVYNAIRFGDEGSDAAMTRAQVMAASIDRLTSHGMEACYDYADDRSDPNAEAREQRARAIVDRLFPELAKV